MKTKTTASLVGALHVLALPGALLPAVEEVPETIVTAYRAEAPRDRVGHAVTLLDGESLRQDGIHTLEEALRRSPGVFSESTGGQRGSISSLFLRGTGTAQSHLRVDGVRLSDSSVSSGNFLGNALLGGVGTIEVLRGPQSALYGGESIGGVVSIRTARGSGEPVSRLTAEGGSFGSFRGALSSGGELGRLCYTLQLAWEETDNDPQGGVADLSHRQLGYALRLDHESEAGLHLGLTVRGGDAEYRDSFGGLNLTDYTLATLFAALDLTPEWSSRVTLGIYQEAYDFGEPSTFATDAEKLSVEWENVRRSGGHLTSVGVVFEHTDYAQDFSFPGEGDLFGLYLNHAWEVAEGVTVSAGGRWEDYEAWGDEFTWRTALAWELPRTGTTLRASFGTGFRAPSLLELNGGPFEAGNPLLEPERSEGWDVGIEQRLGDGAVVTVTWFENEVENLIVDPFGAPGRNLPGKGNANGLEVGLAGRACGDRIRYGLAYTHLQRSLNGQPEHVLDAHLACEVTDRLRLGAGLSHVGERTLGGDRIDRYTLLRLHGTYEVNESIQLSLRVENLTDEEYELISFGGNPERGRGMGIYGGATVVF